MSALSVRLVKAAFLCLALGVGLGVWFAFDRPAGFVLRPLHVELNLWGWVTLLIYGFAYHELPRFAGRPLSWPRVAEAQSWLAIAGVALGAVGSVPAGPAAELRVALGAAGVGLQTLAALLFAANAGSLLQSRPAR